MADQNLSETLNWVTRLLADLAIPYQAVGGLAARAHGSKRPLIDIDLYVPDREALERVVEATGPRVTRAPRHQVYEHRDLVILKVSHGDWDVEIAAADSARFRDRHTGAWREAGIRFDAGEPVEVAGVEVRVMPLPELLDYKEALGRDVDRQDVRELRDLRRTHGL